VTALFRRRVAIMGVFLAISGCKTMATGADIPALISNPGADSHKSLQNVVNDLLNTNVTLADDALTEHSVLTIQRNPPRMLQGQPAAGRNMETPIQFQLVRNGQDCILIDRRDESRHTLEKTSCIADSER
jgi:hypothetical protein